MAHNLLNSAFYALTVATLFLFNNPPAAMELSLGQQEYTSYDDQLKTINLGLHKRLNPPARQTLYPEQADRDATPLSLESIFEAAAKGEAHPVLDYLQQDGSVDIRDDSNRTLLHVAVANGHLHIAEIVLRFGANIDDVLDNDQKTPLDRATARGFDFLRRFLALAYGEFNLQGRWQPVRHHIRINSENPAKSALTKVDYSPTVTRYREARHKTPQQFRKSSDFALFRHQFTNNTFHIKRLTKMLFSTELADKLIEKLNTFTSHVFENDGNYFSTRIDRVYGDIHEDINTIAAHLEALPRQVQKNAIEQLLSEINLCIDGVYTRTQQTLLYINTQTTAEAMVTQSYRHLLEAVAIEHLQNDHSPPPRNEIHYINAYLNYLSGSLIRQTDSAHWPDLQRHDVVSQSLGITETDLEEFAEKAAARVHAAEVVQWLTDRAVDELQGVLPQGWLSSPLQLSQLTGDRLEALNLWFDRLRVIVPGNLTLWELIEETEGGYDFAGVPLQLKRAIVRNFSDRLYPLSQPDLSGRIQTCNNLVYWTDREDRAQPVTFADYQSLSSNRTAPVCDLLAIEVIQSTRTFSQLLHLLIHVLPENRSDANRQLLNTWYTHTLSHKKTRDPFERMVIAAPNNLLQKIGLPVHYHSCFHDNWTGRELLKRLTAEQVEWDGATTLKIRLLQDPGLLTTELIKETEQLSPQQQDRLIVCLVTQGKTDLLRSFPNLNTDTVNRIFDENVALLHKAANMGRTETVRLLLDRGADIHHIDLKLGWNALTSAASNGRTDTVALLIDRGADIHFVNPKQGFNALIAAADRGHTRTVALLLDRGADIYSVNSAQGWNALTSAASNGHTDTVKLLLDRGADIHSVNSVHGWNALNAATMNSHTATVALLLDRGADVHYVNSINGWNALILAAANGYNSILALLLDYGANIHDTNPKNGWSALTAAANNGHINSATLLLDRGADIHSINPKSGWNSLTAAVRNGFKDTAAMLLDRGADIHFVNPELGWNALTVSAHNGFRDTAAMLLDRGADIHFINPVCGLNALLAAIGNGHTETVALLLDKGADIHSNHPENGWNALTSAAQEGHTNTVALLLGKGADVHFVSQKRGWNALTVAAAYGHTDTVALLLNEGADIHFVNQKHDWNALTIAAAYGHTDTVALLLDRGADIHFANQKYGWNALTIATSHGHTDTVAMLLDRGADINSFNPKQGCNALITAINAGHTDTVALLLDRGADIDFVNPHTGWNVLTAAASNGHTDIVALLLDRGADIHSINPKYGWYPLTIAANNGHTETVVLLLDRGSDINLANPVNGWTALSCAKRKGHSAIVDLLVGADTAAPWKTRLMKLLFKHRNPSQ